MTNDDEDAKVRSPVAASVDATQLGAVSWIDARVEFPISESFSLFPQGALLHVAPQAHVSVEEWHPFVGAGVGWDPSDPWHLELSDMYAPPSYDVESLYGELEIQRDFGTQQDGALPVVELDGSVTLKYARWEDGLGPAGSDILQAFVELKPVWHVSSRLELDPEAMAFVYNKALNSAVGDRLGSVSVLARVGTFAPLAFVGGSVGYAFLRWCTPSLAVSEIVYASSIGDATEATLSARIRVLPDLTVSLGGGGLWNRVGGSLVPSDSPRTLPVGRLEISATF